MKRIGVISCLVAAGMLAALAWADTRSSGVGNMLVEVTPTVAVTTVAEPEIQLVQTGQFEGILTFLVEANVSQVCIFVEASGLYLGNDPSNDAVEPIPVDTSVPALIDPMHATPLNGGSHEAAWTGDGTPVGMFDTKLSESICFQSSQDGIFSQEVDVAVTWVQNDPEKRTGMYGGKVRLTALVQPN